MAIPLNTFDVNLVRVLKRPPARRSRWSRNSSCACVKRVVSFPSTVETTTTRRGTHVGMTLSAGLRTELYDVLALLETGVLVDILGRLVGGDTIETDCRKDKCCKSSKKRLAAHVRQPMSRGKWKDWMQGTGE